MMRFIAFTTSYRATPRVTPEVAPEPVAPPPVANSPNNQFPAPPKSPDDLLKQGYNETSHPDAANAGHRNFENPTTGDRLRFDQGKPGAPGHEGNDHYHRYNPDPTGKRDQYLDKHGNPVPRGSDPSHLYPPQV